MSQSWNKGKGCQHLEGVYKSGILRGSEMLLTGDVEGTALVGSHAGHTQVRQATGHLPESQLNCVGAWLVQLGLIHYQRVDLSFLWGMRVVIQLCGGRDSSIFISMLNRLPKPCRVKHLLP